jgi:hypothetical protein
VESDVDREQTEELFHASYLLESPELRDRDLRDLVDEHEPELRSRI